MKALSLQDRTQVKGRHIRMMLSHRVTRLAVNLTVVGIDHSIDSEKLRNLFSAYWFIVSCRVTVKGSGYVQFDSEDSAMAAIISLHETIMQGKKIGSLYGFIPLGLDPWHLVKPRKPGASERSS
ncbi:hypothetical protein TIFTF001_006553 [Ficus carica]|uniref:RRM domain-containing protein n=1 Tax=Ficus carica TaxID=3494 RepID=A0AA88DFS6_FICCA|nr:hypothetical protein TIFTF001_006553 [Ficus carica]